MALIGTIGGTSKAAGPITVGIEVIGLQKTLAAVTALGARAKQAMGGALFREAESIMRDSKGQVPVRKGTLKGSGHVQLPIYQLGEITVTLGYGGPAIPYALRQHEERAYHHRVGKWKYLEDPFRQHLQGLDARLALDIQRQIARRGTA